MDEEPLRFFIAAQRWLAHRLWRARPALIIIDLAKAFTDQQAMLGANLDKASRNQRLFEAARTQDPKLSASYHQIRRQL